MKTLTSSSVKQQQGFTLIELVIVIVILGILAATAAPKFIDLTGDAKSAVVQGVQGSVNSAVNLVHAKALVDNQAGATGEVTINGEVYDLVLGYPTRAGETGTPDGSTGKGWGIDRLIDLESGSDITYDSATGDFEHSEGTTADNCKITYSNATANAAGTVITPPTVILDISAC